VLVLAHLPLLALQARITWEHPHYGFFPLVLLASGLLAARAGARLGPLEPGNDRRAVMALGGSWVLLAGACVMGSPWLGAVAAMSVTAAVIYAAGGGGLLRPLLPAWGLLWLTIPPPLDVDGELIALLQTAATRSSSHVLDLLGVSQLREGNVIRLADRRLLIEEACSGVQSLFTVLAGTIFLALWARRSLARGVALVAAAVVWVVLGNTVRIVAVVELAAHWGFDATTGWRHEALGLTVFAVALGLTASTDGLVSFLAGVREILRIRARERETEPEVQPRAPAPEARPRIPTRLPDLRRTRLASWPLAAAFGGLILAQVVLLPPLMEDYLLPGSMVGSRLLALHADDLPVSQGPFQRQGSQTIRRELGHSSGRFSRLWTYRWGRRTVSVSLDGPFMGWHELTRCYLGQGWTLLERSVQPGESRGSSFAAVRLERGPEQVGELFFSLFDFRGKVLEPWGPGGRLGYAGERLAFWRRQRTYQVQMFVTAGEALTSAERVQAQAFFESARSRLIACLGSGGGEVTP
jgi:exosortase